MRRFLLSFPSVLALLGALSGATPAPAQAGTFAVTNTDDSGPGSLRGAVEAARAADGPDTITFDLAGCPCVITLTSGHISILDPVMIQGPGADLLAVSGNHSSRVFDVQSSAPVSIDALTVRDGIAGKGGGIRNTGTLTVTDSTISGNTADTPELIERAGGGIHNDGTLSVTNSSITGNSVISHSPTSVRGTQGGGGIRNTGTLRVTNSTISGNSAPFGGGIESIGMATVINSTVSGNSASTDGDAHGTDGGGIFQASGSGLTVLNSTLTGNTAAGEGGGIFILVSGLTLGSSLSAGNAAGFGPDVTNSASVNFDRGYNLIGDGRGSGWTDGVNNNLVGTAGAPIDPRLGPLTAGNGGPTPTHALLAGSPAIDHIPEGVNGCGDPGSSDQRGVTRPQGARCDIGAFELVANAAPAVTITAPTENALLAAGQVALAASFTDADAGDAHTCRLVLGDGDETTTDPALDGAVIEPGTDPGACTASQQLGAGVYTLTVTVTDATGEQDSDTVMFVVYDPSAGFVTGGGSIASQAGDCALDAACAAASGSACFGFVSRYKKGASIPTGGTQFVFSAGGLSFHANVYEWLVVNQAGTNAQFKGSGTVNGGDDGNGNPYKFMLWAGDGSGTGGADTFRIRIWSEYPDPDTNEAVEDVVYDNAASNTTDQIAGGSIVIKTK